MSAEVQGFINRKALRAFVKALMGQEVGYLSEDIFCFETVVRALYAGFSLEGITQTAAAQLTIGIICETLALVNGDKAMAARLLQIDKMTLEGWIFSDLTSAAKKSVLP